MKADSVMVEEAYRLAASLPQMTIAVIADAMLTTPPDSLSSELSKRIPHHQHRSLTLTFLQRWNNLAPEIDAAAVALALQMAAYAESVRRKSGSLELVWTGPRMTHTPCRHTEQAILEIIETARHRLLIVSFAVYKIPNIANALVAAVRRGVTLTIIVETPDKIEGAGEYDTIRALGNDVADCSSIYFWPRERRQTGENGKPGILHVKCVVADAEIMMLSSANLTRQAFTINMELGILIRGGDIPHKVDQQFTELIRNQLLQPLWI